jgi:hypothetical protein
VVVKPKFLFIFRGKRRESVPGSIHKDIEKKLKDSTAPLQGYNDAVLWIKQEFGYDLKYHTGLPSKYVTNFLKPLF